MKKVLLASMLGVVLAAVPAFAQETLGPAGGNVGNLEGAFTAALPALGFPVALIDTTTTAPSVFEVGMAATYVTNGGCVYFGLLQANYGLMDGLQLSANMPLVVGEGLVTGNGDLNLDVLWACLAEQGNMPSVGIGGGVRLPTGEGFTGYDGRIVGAMTKTLGQARLHFNAGYTTIGNRSLGVRNDADVFALGMDYPILDNLVLVGELISQEAPVEGADRWEFVEGGVRAALTDTDTLSAGVAVGIGNGNATPDFMATVGYQKAM